MFSLKKPILIGLLSIVVLGSNANQAETIIHAGKLIDGQKDTVQSKMTIVINDNLITEVIKGYKDPSDNDTYLDLKDQTVLPGLMDMHVHFGGEYQSKAQRPIKTERETEAILATLHASVTLKAGFFPNKAGTANICNRPKFDRLPLPPTFPISCGTLPEKRSKSPGFI